jgi:flagellar basal-body rod protein FlgC
MSLITALRINSSGLTAQRQRVEVSSSNLANSETTKTAEGGAYRRKDVVFQSTSFGQTFEAANGGASGVEVTGIVDDMRPFDRRFDPGHPDADKETGYVDYPNVNSMEEMANLVSAARSYEANLAAIAIVKSMISKTLEIGR